MIGLPLVGRLVSTTSHVPLSSEPAPLELLAELREALRTKSIGQVRTAFLDAAGGDYVLSMAANRGGLQNLRIAIIPAPPGWSGSNYWAVFHTVQTIEEDHDAVYQVLEDAGHKWKLGPEIPEDELGGWRIRSQSYRAVLSPSRSRVEVEVNVALVKGLPQAVPFRLNENYRFSAPTVLATDRSIVHPNAGELVRAGSLCIPWTDHLGDHVEWSYSAELPKGNEDEVTAKDAFVTAWWLPSLGRLPFSVEASIDAPRDWKVRAEGVEKSNRITGNHQIASFSCPLPISFPKIVAGRYSEMATTTVNGDRFAVYQLSPTNRGRADADLKSMVRAGEFYRQTLGRLPFHGYESYDADRYFGIESYSHSLLQRNVTHFISHEMAHSYFGGTAPCPYVNDSWNEGFAQYVDSILLNHDADKTLEAGLAAINVSIPLTKMAIPWNLNDATYWRGAYVLKMLEAEIGLENVRSALRSIAKERIGKNTLWPDLRPYFERAAKQPLGWFWEQWIQGSTFPTLTYQYRSDQLKTGQWRTTVHVDQTEVGRPFRLRAAVKVDGSDVKEPVPMLMTDWSSSVSVESRTKPSRVQLIVFPLTLARIKAGPPLAPLDLTQSAKH